jgi:transposase
MPNRVRVLTVPDADRAELERRARAKGAPARVAERARIVLLAADGLTGAQIGERAGCTEPAVIKWRRRYAQCGLAGLEDAPRPGGPRRVLTDEVVGEILAATITPPPDSLQAQGVTHWSGRRLAEWLGRARGISVSHDSIAVLWRVLPGPAPDRGVHVLRRPAAGREDPRRRGPVPGAAAERGGGLRG